LNLIGSKVLDPPQLTSSLFSTIRTRLEERLLAGQSATAL